MKQTQLLLKGKACSDHGEMKAGTASDAAAEAKCRTTPGLSHPFIYGSLKKANCRPTFARKAGMIWTTEVNSVIH